MRWLILMMCCCGAPPDYSVLAPGRDCEHPGLVVIYDRHWMECSPDGQWELKNKIYGQ